MPRGSKTCPECQAEMGVRTLVCKCGYDFKKNKSMKVEAGSEVMEVTGKLIPVATKPVTKTPANPPEKKRPATIAEVYRGQVSTPAGPPPCKPNGFVKDWSKGPCPDEAVSQWAKQVRDLGLEQNKDYSVTAIQYFARYFWDIHGHDYGRVCSVIQQTFA